jgi:REP element-mobilizing transposase RayT
MSKYHIPLHPDKFYHLFNHAIGEELLFRQDKNFSFFLKKYAVHANPICDTYAYNLLPNHFHFAVKIKSFDECKTHFEKIKQVRFNSWIHDMPDFLMERFSNLCNGYTKAYNKFFGRRGALFIDYLKRSVVMNDTYLCNLINYIHFNAVHHGFCKDPLHWKWSSLHTFLAVGRTALKRKETLQMFGSLESFKIAHSRMVRPLPEYEFF